MHPKKAEVLAELAADSRDNDREIREEFARLFRPDRHGFAASLDAGVQLAMNVSSAFFLDIARFAASRIDDDTWDHMDRDSSSSHAL
jgi:hypothetical protein